MDILVLYLKKYKLYIFLLIFAIVTILSLQIKEEVINEEEIKTLKVDIKGAVNNPGVYELNLNSRVSDAINISGGITNEADTNTINLSKTLKDEMVIVIYTKEEIEKINNPTIKYIENECVCPKVKNDVCIEQIVTNIETNIEKNNTNMININTATIEELITLSGIGESKAKKIIEYRELNGRFNDIEEIKNIAGIGDSIYEKIKDHITI